MDPLIANNSSTAQPPSGGFFSPGAFSFYLTLSLVFTNICLNAASAARKTPRTRSQQSGHRLKRETSPPQSLDGEGEKRSLTTEAARPREGGRAKQDNQPGASAPPDPVCLGFHSQATPSRAWRR